MPTTLNSFIQYTHSFSEKGISPLKRFLTWSKNQQHNHFMWIGIGIALQGVISRNEPLPVLHSANGNGDGSGNLSCRLPA